VEGGCIRQSCHKKGPEKIKIQPASGRCQKKRKKSTHYELRRNDKSRVKTAGGDRRSRNPGTKMLRKRVIKKGKTDQETQVGQKKKIWPQEEGRADWPGKLLRRYHRIGGQQQRAKKNEQKKKQYSN